MVKVDLDIKVNSYLTLTFSSNFENGVSHYYNEDKQLLLKIPPGPSLSLIKKDMECNIEIQGNQPFPGQIADITAIDDGAVLTIGYKKEQIIFP